MRTPARVVLVAGLLLAAAASAAARRRSAQPQFAPVTLDHLFEENLTYAPRAAHGEGAGQDSNGADEVCMGDMCWTNVESAALSNIVRAYLMPRYGIDPMFERRLLQGVFSSLLAQHWSDKVSAELVPDADGHAAAHEAAKPKKKRGWLNRRAAGRTGGKSADRRENEGSGASGRHSKQHYLATWALMLARRHTHVVSRTELLIGAYLAEQWIYDPYPSCLTLAAGGASVSSVRRDGAALGNYTAVSRSDGHRVSYQQRPPLAAKKSSSASSQPSFRVAYDEVVVVVVVVVGGGGGGGGVGGVEWQL